MIKVYKKFSLMILLTILIYLIVYSFSSYADEKKLNNVLDRILDKIDKQEKLEKDAFFKCWLENVKPNSTDSHTNVVALYCSNKTGYKP